MPDGSQISRSQQGELLKDCINRVQVRTSALFKIVSPDTQESLDKQATSQVNIQTYAATELEDEEERNARIEAYKLAIYKHRQKKKQCFDGVKLPARNKGKARANAAASTSKAPAAPKPTAPAQPAPAIIPKPSKPFIPTTDQPMMQLPHEPNFRYAAPIKDRAVGTALFNRMLNTPLTITAHEILATAPEVRKNQWKSGQQYFKDNDGFLYFRDANYQPRLCVPASQRNIILKEAHKNPFESAHAGPKKLWQKLSQKFYWHHMKVDILRFCRSCDTCQKTKPSNFKTQMSLSSSHHPQHDR
jgi:hypothetical protein